MGGEGEREECRAMGVGVVCGVGKDAISHTTGHCPLSHPYLPCTDTWGQEEVWETHCHQ